MRRSRAYVLRAPAEPNFGHRTQKGCALGATHSRRVTLSLPQLYITKYMAEGENQPPSRLRPASQPTHGISFSLVCATIKTVSISSWHRRYLFCIWCMRPWSKPLSINEAAFRAHAAAFNFLRRWHVSRTHQVMKGPRKTVFTFTQVCAPQKWSGSRNLSFSFAF
jgi:hypothetical protein